MTAPTTCPHCGGPTQERAGWHGDRPIYLSTPCQCAKARAQRKATALAVNEPAA